MVSRGSPVREEAIVHSGVIKTAKLCPIGVASLLLLGACGEEDLGVRGSGTVEATEITISARTQGELLSVDAEEGEVVEEGELLAQIEREDLELQLQQAEHRLEATQAQLDLLLAGARNEDLRQGEAQLEQAEQAFELSSKSYRRVQHLYEDGSATPSDLDRAETEFEQARSRVASAQAQVEKLRSMARPEEVRASRAKVAEAQAGVERVRRRLADTLVHAPRAGTVTIRAREAGEYVSPGTPLFTVADLRRVYLTIYIPEPSLGRIALKQEAELFVDGLPERTFRGRVTHIAEEAEFTPKNVQTQDARAQLVFAVEIAIDNSEGVFKIGMPADARIVTEPE